MGLFAAFGIRAGSRKCVCRLRDDKEATMGSGLQPAVRTKFMDGSASHSLTFIPMVSRMYLNLVQGNVNDWH